MPFDWLHVKPVKRPQNREVMYRRELQERAALLHRLGYSKEAARKRLAANMEWDNEVGAGRQALADQEIDRIVDEAWKRGGPGAGGAPSL